MYVSYLFWPPRPRSLLGRTTPEVPHTTIIITTVTILVRSWLKEYFLSLSPIQQHHELWLWQKQCHMHKNHLVLDRCGPPWRRWHGAGSSFYLTLSVWCPKYLNQVHHWKHSHPKAKANDELGTGNYVERTDRCLCGDFTWVALWEGETPWWLPRWWILWGRQKCPG